MKKSNRASIFYILSCFVLLAGLVFGGCYGIYLSVGLNFVRNSLSNITEGAAAAGGAQNVSFGASVNFPRSMIGVIILSIVLIVLAVLDMISLVSQVILFKQFKAVRESKIEKKIEQKIEKKGKSKGGVIFFACLIDVLSLAAGVFGIFVNFNSLAGGNFVWILYVAHGLVAIFSVISFVLLIIRLKQAKANMKIKTVEESPAEPLCVPEREEYKIDTADDINDLENKLLKLRYLKASRLISPEEYQKLRERFFLCGAREEVTQQESSDAPENKVNKK